MSRPLYLWRRCRALKSCTAPTLSFALRSGDGTFSRLIVAVRVVQQGNGFGMVFLPVPL